MTPKEEIRAGVWGAALALVVLAGVALWLMLGESGSLEGTLPPEELGAFDPDDPEYEAWALNAPDAGASASSAGRVFGGGPAPENDPQIRAMLRTVGGADAGVGPSFTPKTYGARITSVRGHESVYEGATCDVRVLPVRTRSFNCLVRVQCDGVVLYPDGLQRAGYAPCEIENGVPFRAVDDGYSSADGDPAVDVDLVARRVRVSDESPEGVRFEAELRLDALL